MSNSKSTIWPPDESAYKKIIFKLLFQNQNRECSGSVVECLSDQPRKTHPFIAERLFMGRKESHKTKQPEQIFWMFR